MTSANARTLGQRQADAQQRLASGHQFWLATGSDGRGPWLIPVDYVWNGTTFITATLEHSRTVANLRSEPRARVAIGDTMDLVMIDVLAEKVPVADVAAAEADEFAQLSRDPRAAPEFVYIRLTPQRMQVWNGSHEIDGRTVMLNGHWLDQPVD